MAVSGAVSSTLLKDELIQMLVRYSHMAGEEGPQIVTNTYNQIRTEAKRDHQKWNAGDIDLGYQ